MKIKRNLIYMYRGNLIYMYQEVQCDLQWIRVHMLVLSCGLNSSPVHASSVTLGLGLCTSCFSSACQVLPLRGCREVHSFLPVCFLLFSAMSSNCVSFQQWCFLFSSSCDHWFQFVVLKTFLELVFLHSFYRPQHQPASTPLRAIWAPTLRSPSSFWAAIIVTSWLCSLCSRSARCFLQLPGPWYFSTIDLWTT